MLDDELNCASTFANNRMAERVIPLNRTYEMSCLAENSLEGCFDGGDYLTALEVSGKSLV